MINNKIDEQYQNILDKYMMKLVEWTEPIYHKLNFTPNQLTTLSLVFGLLCIFFILARLPVLASVCIFLSYYFDVLDGYYARKHNMETNIGYYYDRVSDFIVIFGIFSAIRKVHADRAGMINLVSTLLNVMIFINVGCQEKKLGKQDNSIMGMFRDFCFNEDVIHYSKYFTKSTYILFIIFILNICD